jgi:hypothetical protein
VPINSILISRKQCCLPLGHCVLTFDDGPAAEVTDDLLAILRKVSVKAYFCLVGSQVVTRPKQTRAIATAGHKGNPEQIRMADACSGEELAQLAYERSGNETCLPSRV